MTATTVVLTQASEAGDSLARQLAEAGMQVEHWPLVTLAPVDIGTIAPVLRRLDEYDWVLLPSPSAVRLVAQQMKALGLDWPAPTRAGLVGPASVEAFRECFGAGIPVDTPPGPPHDAAHLIRTLPQDSGETPAGDACRRRALVLNRPDGRTRWLDSLKDRMQSVDVVAAYTAEPVRSPPPPELMWRLQRLQRGDARVPWIVGAASQVDTLLEHLPGELLSWARRQPLLVPHPAIMAHAQAAGFDRVMVYTDRRDLVERLQYLAHSHGPTPPQSADQDADNEETSALSLDQQKASAIPSAGPDDDKVKDAKVIGETSASAPATPRPASATAAPSSSGALSASAGMAPSPAGKTPASPAMTPASPTAAPAAATPAAVTSVSAATAPGGSAASPSSIPASSTTPSSTSPSSTSPSSTSPSSTSPSSTQASSTGPGARPPFASPAYSSPPPRMPEPPAPVPPGGSGGRSGRGGAWWALPLLLLVLLLALGGWWYTQQRFLETERENARRVQEAESRASRLEEQLKTLRDSQNQLLARSSTLETRIAESATQQEQLASLYDEMAKSRGDSTLAEVEQSVVMANQHLELTGNVQAALLALENAQRRLGDSDQSQAIGARRVILQDIEKLKALPEVDITRAAARLDQIINRVDRLPLLADANEGVAAPKPAPAASSPAASARAAPSAAAAPGVSTPSSPGSAAAPPATGVAPAEPAGQAGQGASDGASPQQPPSPSTSPSAAPGPAATTGPQAEPAQPAPTAAAPSEGTSPANPPAEATPASPATAPAATPAPSLAAAPSEPAATASAPAPPPAADASGPPAGERSALQRLYDSIVDGGARSLDALRDEFRGLVTIRRIDKPDSLLLSPEQKQMARENLKMMLLNARLNLLNRHEELFRQDVSRVIEGMQRLFDTEHQDVKSTIAALQNLQAQQLAQELPSLSESLAAVKAARAASEKRS